MCAAVGRRDREEDIATLQPLTHTQIHKTRNRKVAILIHQLLLQMSSSAARSADGGGGAQLRRGLIRNNVAVSQAFLSPNLQKSRFAAFD